MVFHLDAAAVVACAERKDVDGADAGHAGQPAQARFQLLVERHLLAFLVSRRRQRHFHGQELLGREAGVHALQVPEVRTSSPAPTSNMIDMATSPAISSSRGAAAERRTVLAAAFLQ